MNCMDCVLLKPSIDFLSFTLPDMQFLGKTLQHAISKPRYLIAAWLYAPANHICSINVLSSEVT